MIIPSTRTIDRSYDWCVEHQLLLPSFKKKTGPKPKYASIAERNRVLSQRRREKLRRTKIARFEIKMPEHIADKVKARADKMGRLQSDVALELLVVGLVSLETETTPTEIAPTSST